MTTYEIVRDFDEVEHVVLRAGAGWEYVPVCDGIGGEKCFDGPAPEMCEECQRRLAAIGDRDLLAAAVAGARARWLACLPGASPLQHEVHASARAD